MLLWFVAFQTTHSRRGTTLTSSEQPSSGRQLTGGWSTLSVHGGEERQKANCSLVDPIFCSATYTFANTQSLIDFIVGKLPREEYARYGNPNERTVERKLAALEGAEAAVLYSSGMTAFAGLFFGKLSAGDEIVLFDECYIRTRDFCLQELPRFGITTRLVPTGDYEKLEAAITRSTRLLVAEVLTNPHLSVVDLERFAHI